MKATPLDTDTEAVPRSATPRTKEETRAGDARGCVIVDGNNLMGSRPDGWWRDRAGASVRTTEQVRAHARADPERAWTVVFDGHASPRGPESCATLEVRHAGSARPDAADDQIVALARERTRTRAVEVVTSDRRLRERVEALGARTRGVSSLAGGSAGQGARKARRRGRRKR